MSESEGLSLFSPTRSATPRSHGPVFSIMAEASHARHLIKASSYEWQPLAEERALPTAYGQRRRGTMRVGIAWFAASALFSTWANTAFLRSERDPFLHALVRFSTSACIGLASAARRPGHGLILRQVPGLMRALWLPSACLLAANVLNSVALQLSGITITYVAKSTIPLLTVGWYTLRGETFSRGVYLALLPTVIGVAVASWSDAEYSAAGLAAALASAVAQLALNLTSRSALSALGLSGPHGQCILACSCAAACVLACGLAQAGSQQHAGRTALQPPAEPGPPRAILFASAGLAYHIEYSLNFSFVRLVTPLAFSVADVARRLAVIVAGAVIFAKPLTALNASGVLLALGGVLGFLLAARASGHGGAAPRRRPRQPGRSR